MAPRRSLAVGVAALALIVGCRPLVRPDPDRLAAVEPVLGQLLLVGFHGTTPEDAEGLERLLCQAGVGGALIFGRNVVDAEQVARLTAWMAGRARACTGRALLIAADAEGGQVMRLSPEAGWTGTISPQELGEANDLALTELEARRIGAMLRAAGINWNLAPVVDVGYNPANPVIVARGRSFGANPLRVTAQARAYVRGMRRAGMLTSLKHFPGHGSSQADSHTGFVDVTTTANTYAELWPYRALAAEDLIDTVMTAHVFNRRLDPRYPATLSPATIDGLLRGGLGWDGLVVTDDLRMAAIEERYGLERAAVLALEAGVDMLLIADDRLPDGRSAAGLALTAIREALGAGRLTVDRVETALRRVEDLRRRLP